MMTPELTKILKPKDSGLQIFTNEENKEIYRPRTQTNFYQKTNPQNRREKDNLSTCSNETSRKRMIFKNKPSKDSEKTVQANDYETSYSHEFKDHKSTYKAPRFQNPYAVPDEMRYSATQAERERQAPQMMKVRSSSQLSYPINETKGFNPRETETRLRSNIIKPTPSRKRNESEKVRDVGRSEVSMSVPELRKALKEEIDILRTESDQGPKEATATKGSESGKTGATKKDDKDKQNNANQEGAKKCWEESPEDIDPVLFDSITNFDPEYWQNILSEENLRKTNMDLGLLMEKNTDYFNHMFALCACYRCECGLCVCKYIRDASNCKLQYKGGFQSIYGKDFGPKDASDFRLRVPDQNFYSSPPGGKSVFDQATTHLTDYKPFKIDARRPTTQESSNNNTKPFMGLTSYNSAFVDWQTYTPSHMKKPQFKTVLSELPFLGASTYSKSYTDHFKSGMGEKIPNFQERMGRSPLGNDNIPFLGESLNRLTYKSFKVAPTKDSEYRPSKPHKNQSDLMKTQMNFSTPGKMMTTTGRDFRYEPPWICPAKKKISKELIRFALAKKLEEIMKRKKADANEAKEENEKKK